MCGTPSPLGEDDIPAWVESRPDTTITPQELFDFFARELPYLASPRYVHFMTSLPKSPRGRTQKHALRETGVGSTTIDFEARGLAVARAKRRG